MTLDSWGDLGLLATAGGFVVLGLLWLICTRWYKESTGRGLAAFFIVTDVIMIWSALRTLNVIPGGRATEIARVALFWALAGVMLSLIVGFVRIQFWPDGWPWYRWLRKRLPWLYGRWRGPD